jgi:hypothetical protein
VGRTIAGRPLSLAETEQLFGIGSTGVLHGFVSRAGKEFSAKLVLQKGRVVFEYPESAKRAAIEAHIRVESFNSGTAAFHINGPCNKTAEMSFGLVPSRMAECLALIAALKYVAHGFGQNTTLTIRISLNNLDLSRYLLRERKPREKDVAIAVRHVFCLLDEASSWSAEFSPRQRPKLRGGNKSTAFPKGVFPWLDVQTLDLGSEIEIRLPEDPSVIANFRASVKTAHSLGGGVFRVPAAASPVVRAWAASVKGPISVNQNTRRFSKC